MKRSFIWENNKSELEERFLFQLTFICQLHFFNFKLISSSSSLLSHSEATKKKKSMYKFKDKVLNPSHKA